jgi:GntR family transcriptional regulator
MTGTVGHSHLSRINSRPDSKEAAMAEFRYREIAEELRGRIESGEIGPGGQLPTELELRHHYEASRNTVRDAVKLLTNQGLVVTRRGQGMFVNQPTAPLTLTVTVDPKAGLVGVEGQTALAEIRTLGRFPSVTAPRVEVLPATAEIAELLDVPAGAEVITRRQKWYVDGMPWSLQTTAYRGELAADAPDLLTARDIGTGTMAYIERTTGIMETGRRDRILQRRASTEEGLFFGIPDDVHVPVTAITRTGYRGSESGQVPLRATTTVYLADRVQFIIDSGIVPQGDGSPRMNDHDG